MSFTIRQIDRTATGREIVRVGGVDKTRITLGRSAQSDVHLADLALDAQHAVIEQAARGRITVTAISALGFTLDGAHRQSATVDPRGGAELGFGSHRVTVSADEAGACVLTVREVSEPADALDNRRGFSLAGVLPGKRGMAWASALAILMLLLIVPIATHKLNAADPKTTVIGDASWRPGKLSRAHHGLEAKCESCHVQGFVAVRDESCRSCHKDTHDHALAARLGKARAEPGMGAAFLRAVAGVFNKPGPGACTSCHLEHEGAGPMALPPQKFCADCHGSLSERLTDTRLGNAADFGKAHPQFRPLAVTDAASRSLSRLSLDSPAKEDNGLTFPHKVHLDPLSGVTRMAVSLGTARGYGRKLDCASCHRPTEDGVRFQPIKMERDCQACHSLAYDRVGSTVRTLHHGDIDQALADIATRTSRSPVVGNAVLNGRQRPGAFGPGGPYYSNFSPAPAGGGAFSLAFARGGICGECHTATTRGGKFAVTPVTLRTRYMQNGWFDHRAHRQTQCKDCHAANTSTRSSDLLLPPIATCRNCHTGESASWTNPLTSIGTSIGTSTAPKIPSGCAMCHSYHLPTFVAGRERGNRKQVAGVSGLD